MYNTTISEYITNINITVGIRYVLILISALVTAFVSATAAARLQHHHQWPLPLQIVTHTLLSTTIAAGTSDTINN